MNNEIKKALYREKPVATEILVSDIPNVSGESELYSLYRAKLSDGYVAAFGVPHKEMGEKRFHKEVPAQLLIRWLISDGSGGSNA